mmetsp:Transcript_95123/g.188441  ORF Transcript_95123/g.188441 Transcript_95123/m.188441 type:complete len:406 (-) Transcript_95123:151-1368(-)|eukprot:CAMPEP_0172756284 /NCGR_PEP_ID=MMETSP1074-20121228/161521_1 /TAXON_ID=2916 /ORGANISM="Ceratium fusus, Strain PA161109" /LENGTH=405 /DNA_ID=CAMNT_0013589509 /DNA_START=32 /DNA_END=1249 /DNA_ORIENTATION=+
MVRSIATAATVLSVQLQFLRCPSISIQAQTGPARTFHNSGIKEDPLNDCRLGGDEQQWWSVFGGLAPLPPAARPGWAYRPNSNETLLVESDCSAWNNVRMSWETAVCFAYKTKRWHRVPHIPVDDWADSRLKSDLGNDKHRRRDLFDYYDEDNFRSFIPTMLDSDPLPVGEVFTANYDPWTISMETLTGSQHAHLVYPGGMKHLNTRVFSQYADDKEFTPHAEYVKLIGHAFRVRRDLMCLTIKRLMAFDLVPFEYVALHRRRGDTVGLERYGVSAAETAEHVRELVQNRTVLVLTDTHEPNFLELLTKVSGASRVVTWADRTWYGDERVYNAQIDMLAAVPASAFIGSKLSTFSTGIVRWRTQAGTHKVGSPVYWTSSSWVPGYEGWESPGARGTYLVGGWMSA